MDIDPNQNLAVAIQARAEIDRARRKAFVGELISTLRKQPDRLLSEDHVQEGLPIRGQHYKGL